MANAEKELRGGIESAIDHSLHISERLEQTETLGKHLLRMPFTRIGRGVLANTYRLFGHHTGIPSTHLLNNPPPLVHFLGSNLKRALPWVAFGGAVKELTFGVRDELQGHPNDAKYRFTEAAVLGAGGPAWFLGSESGVGLPFAAATNMGAVVMAEELEEARKRQEPYHASSVLEAGEEGWKDSKAMVLKTERAALHGIKFAADQAGETAIALFDPNQVEVLHVVPQNSAHPVPVPSLNRGDEDLHQPFVKSGSPAFLTNHEFRQPVNLKETA